MWSLTLEFYYTEENLKTKSKRRTCFKNPKTYLMINELKHPQWSFSTWKCRNDRQPASMLLWLVPWQESSFKNSHSNLYRREKFQSKTVRLLFFGHVWSFLRRKAGSNLACVARVQSGRMSGREGRGGGGECDRVSPFLFSPLHLLWKSRIT